jgi:FkbM family methyltransferase
LIIKTKHKILIARLIQTPIILLRKAIGLSARTKAKRAGICWYLDLNEGIDFAIYLTGKFEPETVATMTSLIKSGDVVLDVGANIGAHTLSMAHMVGEKGRVIAFEPTKYAFDKLVANAKLNPHLQSKITLNQMMLTASETAPLKKELYSSWPLDPKKQMHKKHLGNLQMTCGARVQTLSSYVNNSKIKNVKLVKIDVDGYEIDVLEGGLDFFKKQQPIIIMELAPYTLEERGKSLDELLGILEGMGYYLLDQSSKKPLAMTPKKLKQQIPEGGSINVIARPNK